jgi:hypothetical protein
MADKSVDKKDWGGRMDPLAARPNLFYSASPRLTRKSQQLPYPAWRLGRLCPLPVCGHLRLIIITAPAMLFVSCEDAN